MDDFSLTGAGLDLTFTLPANPVPEDSFRGFYFSVGDVTFTENGVTSVADSAIFETKPNGGGFTLLDAEFNVIDGLDFTGRKLFTRYRLRPDLQAGHLQPHSRQLRDVGGRPVFCKEAAIALQGFADDLAGRRDARARLACSAWHGRAGHLRCAAVVAFV